MGMPSTVCYDTQYSARRIAVVSEFAVHRSVRTVCCVGSEDILGRQCDSVLAALTHESRSCIAMLRMAVKEVRCLRCCPYGTLPIVVTPACTCEEFAERNRRPTQAKAKASAVLLGNATHMVHKSTLQIARRALPGTHHNTSCGDLWSVAP